MYSKNKKPGITVNSDLINDFHFLITEVKNICKMVQEITNTLNVVKLDQLSKREAYIDSLKNRIESLSYDSIFTLKNKHKTLVSNYRALIQITINVHRIGEFLIQAGKQVYYIQDPKSFKEFDLDPFYDIIQLNLSKTFTSLSEVNRDLAEELCKAEVTLDELYIEHFEFIKANISKKKMSHDMMTLLFIVRYFERIGDRFLIIGENILTVAVGETIDIQNYQNLQEVVEFLSKHDKSVNYEFKPFLFSRSGCKVGKLVIRKGKDYENTFRNYFYKSGDTQKIVEEIEGLKLWKKYFPDTVPEVIWKSVTKSDSTLVVSFLKGENFLKYVLETKKEADLQIAINAIKDKLKTIWGKQIQKGKKRSELIKQITSRKGEITKVHKDFFDELSINKRGSVSFDEIIKNAQSYEKQVRIPFTVLCHGDFNLDNLIYSPVSKKVRFVDVHRSGFKDYAQELSVFVVSALRIKLEDEHSRKRIKFICWEMYQFGKRFAHKYDDKYFEARFALGLFRSFVTSTRFLVDDDWYHKMRENAICIFQDVEDARNDLKKMHLNFKKILR